MSRWNPGEGRRRRLYSPSMVEFSMLAAIITLSVLGCSSKSDALRSARYDPMILFDDDDLRRHVLEACHQGKPSDVSRYEELPACKLADHEEALKKSGWHPPAINSGTASIR